MATRVITWITGVLTLLLATFAFILSFNSLSALALEHGVTIPALFPFVVEFAVVIFSLNALHRSLTDQSALVQWSLIIFSSTLAGLFNVVHAAGSPVGMLMAAMPSLFLLLSFESFLSLIRFSVQSKPKSKPKQIKPKPASQKQKRPATKKAERLDSMATLLRKEVLQPAELAERFSVSRQTIHSDIRELEAANLIERNGAGYYGKR